MQRLSISKQRGFTLVELAVVAPLMIVIAMAIVSILILLVSATVGPNAQSSLMQQSEKALDIIEGDINNSTAFVSSSLPANFSDSHSSDYASPPANTTVMRVHGFDQILNPSESSGTKVIPAFKDSVNCNNVTNLNSTNIVQIVALYYVNNNTLYRRTLVDGSNPSACGTKLAKTSCLSGCSSKDLELLRADQITKFELVYYTTITGSVVTTDPTQAKSAQITISSELDAGGETQKYTATFRAARLN